MLVDHLRNEFMSIVATQRVVLIAHQDVDALCTVKILTSLFKTEGVSYILLSCNGVTDLKTKYLEYCSQSNIFILVNCGVTIDLLTTLECRERDKIFFLLDYHRPVHVLNYYNDSRQVRIISDPEDVEGVPSFDEIFGQDPGSDDEESDEEMEEDEEEDDNGMTARMRRRAEKQHKRMEYKEWVERRTRLLFDYRESSYYAKPTALHALQIAWTMSREDMDSIWCAIVSLTDFYVSGRISRERYTEFASTTNDHILRIANAAKLPRDCLKIRFERELYLFLYRSWSIYESVRMTPYVANCLKTWSLDGNRKFHQMLAYLGLPLVEVKQKYLNMSMDLRRQLIDMFSSDVCTENYKLANAVFGSFVAEIGFRPKFNALDTQLATLAVMEDPDASKSCEVKFIEAMKLLNVRDQDSFRDGVEKAKTMLKLLHSQVQMMVDTKQMQEVGPFIIIQLSDTLLEFNYFKRCSAMPLLVHYLQHAGIRCGKRKWKQTPWIVMIPYSSEYFTAVGVQPGAFENDDKNIFSEVFRVMQERMPEDILLDNFDGWAILVKTSQRQNFVDQLLAISE